MANAVSSAGYHPQGNTSLVQTPGKAATRRSGSALTSASTTEDLWSQILTSVETARSTPICPVVILGEPQSGKSTLIRGLAERCPSGYLEPNAEILEGEAGPSTHNSPTLEDKRRSTSRGKRDLGLAYGYCDVPDEEGEDIVARLSLFTLSSSDESLLPLLPFAFRSKDSGSGSLDRQRSSLDTIRSSMFLITLDWERPQSFLEELRTWTSVIRELVNGAVRQGDERMRRAQEAFLQEMKEAVEAQIRSYTGPSSSALHTLGSQSTTAGDDRAADTSGAAVIVPVTAPVGLGDARGLPLEEGVLDDNLGVGIVVVLTKSDTLGKLERDRDFREEQFDYAQQVLRTICLKYGAALFSTAQSRPASFAVLRKYLLHRLLPLNASQSASASRYSFAHAPSTIERDVLLVPSGWDSWGKIVALREGFSPRSTAQGWKKDCEVEERRRSEKLPKAQLGEVEKAINAEEGGGERGSACRLWEDVISDWNGQRTSNQTATQVQPPDAQSFLSQHYASLQKEASASADPRARFARPSLTSSSSTSGPSVSPTPRDESDGGAARSIIGPMQSGGLSGPAVERAMGLAQREDGVPSATSSSTDEIGASSRPKASRRESRDHRSIVASAAATVTGGLGGSTSSSSRAPPHSPMLPGARESPSPSPGATKQSEVLQSFFQDLLRGKSGGSSGGGGAGLRSGPPSSGRRSGQGIRSDGSDSRGEGDHPRP